MSPARALDAGARKSAVRWTFVAALIGIVLLKLWLTSHIRIIPAQAPHDASNFLEHANSVLRGHWFGPYSDLTLIKGPAFPLYMAAVQELGLPLPLAHQLLYAFASLLACAAIRPLVRGRIALLAVFTAVLFDPFTFATLAWVAYRSQLTESVALITLACAAALWLRRNRDLRRQLPWFAGLAAALPVFWLTREEGIWLVPGLAIFLVPYGWDAVRRSGRERVLRLAGLVVPVVMVFVAIQAVSAINLRVYGWYTAVEMQAPEFVSAYNSLSRIVVPPKRFIPVPRAAWRIAYRVSPAAQQLQKGLESGPGPKWMQLTCEFGLPCDEIGGGWFMWALRDSVAVAGHYVSGADARAFYVQLSREIDAACDAGTIACRKKGRTMVPPIHAADVPALVGDVVKGARIAATFSLFQTDHWPVAARNAELERDYLFVTRSIETGQPGQVFEGWMVHPALRAIAVSGPGGPDATASITFKPSPDVEQALRDTPAIREDTALVRFTVETQCEDQCVLEVSDRAGHASRIPLTLAARDFRAGDAIVYHLDDVTHPATSRRDFDDGAKTAVLRRIGGLYEAAAPYALAFATLIAMFRGMRALRRRSFAALRDGVVVLGVLASAASLIAILAIIDTFSFPSFNPEYLGGLFPLLIFGSATAVAAEAAVIARAARRSDVSRARWLAYGALFAGGTFLLAMFVRFAPEAAAGTAQTATPPVHDARAFSCARALTPGAGVARGAVDVVGTATAPAVTTATVAANDTLVVRGWAADALGRQPLAGVCLMIDGRVVPGQSVLYGATRADVATALNQPNVADTGYEIRLRRGRLAPGTHTVDVVGVDERGREEAVAAGRRIVVRK